MRATHLRMDGSWRVLPAGRRTAPGDQVRLVLANERWQAVGVRLGMVDLLKTRQADAVFGSRFLDERTKASALPRYPSSPVSR